MSRALVVLDPGPLTTVQDLGRRGWAHLGVPRSGVLDAPAARYANRLVGNPDDAASRARPGAARHRRDRVPNRSPGPRRPSRSAGTRRAVGDPAGTRRHRAHRRRAAACGSSRLGRRPARSAARSVPARPLVACTVALKRDDAPLPPAALPAAAADPGERSTFESKEIRGAGATGRSLPAEAAAFLGGSTRCCHQSDRMGARLTGRVSGAAARHHLRRHRAGINQVPGDGQPIAAQDRQSTGLRRSRPWAHRHRAHRAGEAGNGGSARWTRRGTACAARGRQRWRSRPEVRRRYCRRRWTG
jgi:hypothetical protein